MHNVVQKILDGRNLGNERSQSFASKNFQKQAKMRLEELQFNPNCII